MRKQIWLPCAFVVVCVLLLFRVMQHQNVAAPEERETSANQSIGQSEPKEMAPERSALTSTNVSGVPPNPLVTASATASMNSNELADQILASWQAPIEFYGKVVDESGNAIAGAKVSFHWVEVPKPDGNRGSTTESDPEGLFSLQGARGPSLTVSVSKEGYRASRQGLPEFRYGLSQEGNFLADPHNPVLFRLKKKGAQEPLVSLKHNYPIPRDGAPVSVNLETGATTPDGKGNIVLRCWTEDQGKQPGEKYDWRCNVTLPDGGLVLTEEEFPFLAPEAGYKPSAEISMPADREKWTSDVDLRFFFRLADGRYGRMTFSMIAGGQHFCMIDSVLNPTGSRNLEPPN